MPAFHMIKDYLTRISTIIHWLCLMLLFTAFFLSYNKQYYRNSLYSTLYKFTPLKNSNLRLLPSCDLKNILYAAVSEAFIFFTSGYHCNVYNNT